MNKAKVVKKRHCPRCDGEIAIAEMLAKGLAYSRELDIYSVVCPACEQGLELRVRTGRMEIGYTYWAGSMHFEAVATFSVAGLRRHQEGDRVGIALGDRVYWHW